MQWHTRLFRRHRRYEDLAVSIQYHIAERADELMESGMPQVEAEQAARREFGNVALIEQRSREAWQWLTLESILFDVRFAVRQLIKSPGFTAAAVMTLALGIAVNASMFSLVSAFLLPKLPGRNPQSLVVVSSVNPDASMQGDTYPVSAPNYLAWSADKRVFIDLSATSGNRAGSIVEPGQQAEAVSYATVSANYFSVFAAPAELGRTFLAGEDKPGHDHVVILSHSLWARRYNSDVSILGRTVRLNREDYVVAGVMPASFRLLGFTPQLWTPLTLTAGGDSPDARKNRFLYLFARLAPGVTLKDAQVQMRIFAQRAQEEYPGAEKRWGISVRMLPDFLIHNFGIRTALAIIMTVVGFVLLIACANVAGLLLTRATSRQKELAIRMSLGASRARVVGQLLTEGVLIALFGGLLSLGLTWVGIHALRAGLSFNPDISAVPISLDGRVLLFVVAVSLISAILASAVPAVIASRSCINTALKSETRGGTSGSSTNRLRIFLVGGEIALTVFLLIGTFQLIRAIYLVDHQTLGFNHDHILTAGLVLDHERYADETKQRQFVGRLTSRLEQIPGVEQAAIVSNLPSSGWGSVPFHIQGVQETRLNQQFTAADAVVTDDYFQTARIPILSGRTFTKDDDATDPRVVVVNREFVHRYFPGSNPIGKQIQLEVSGTPLSWSEIVGVVSDVRNYSEDTTMSPQVYEAYQQRPLASFSLMLRSNLEEDSLASALRHAVGQFDADLPLLHVISMDGVIDRQRNGNPLFEKLLLTFALFALILAAVGIYGLIAHSVSQRSHEISIRLALGANSTDILRMILVQGLKVAVVGSGIGMILALPLPKLFESIFAGLRLSGTAAAYPIVLIGILCAISCATFAPARRATLVDPASALKSE